jgi:DNA-binding transcriptional ArsR family regulator
MTTPQLIWDLGTAYDLFVSLAILHKPTAFGLRGAWTAGVRARISPAEREILDESMSMLFMLPFRWVHSLPQPKNSITALWALDQTPPAERLALLAFQPTTPAAMTDLFREVSARGSWDKKDIDAYRVVCECELDKEREDDKLERELAWWANSAEFGERYLGALRSYHQAFFAEEEKRIRPALEKALARAQELAKELPLPDLLEKLSHGLRYTELPKVAQLVLVPSFWSTPFVFMDFSGHSSGIWLFGARPADASLIPGELVPAALLRALKALSDPTRLRILHALAREPHSPAQLARHLRLRAPTVTHHMKSLRAAGLVQMTVGEHKEPQRYAVRSEAIATTCATLQNFLSGD